MGLSLISSVVFLVSVRDSGSSAPRLRHYSYLNRSHNGSHLFPTAIVQYIYSNCTL